jgi:hypothetical protein
MAYETEIQLDPAKILSRKDLQVKSSGIRT